MLSITQGGDLWLTNNVSSTQSRGFLTLTGGCLYLVRDSNNWLKSALAVSTNTPRVPPPPIATVHSPPEYAQPCWGTQFMPLSFVNEPANVLNIIETVAQNWADICAISSDMSMLVSKSSRLPSRLNSPAATTPSMSSNSCSVATSLAPFLSPVFPSGLSLNTCMLDPSEAQHKRQMHYSLMSACA